jgi:predicted nucleotidyltransferase component of viral defense system
MGCCGQHHRGARPLIPRAYITHWGNRAPWPTETQIEQDLILSRLIVEIANHDVLASEVALRGGTCMHKLHLPAPLRYSEDIDYVRRTEGGVAPIMAAIREVATGAGLVENGYEQNFQMVHMVFDAEPTSGVGRIRVKVETNIRETDSFEARETLPYQVDSPWWSGNADVPTFSIEELMGTKFRALYQRRKGRDVFDLWLALTRLDADVERIMGAFRHYIGDNIFGFADLARNLKDKLANREFLADLDQLLVEIPDGYAIDTATDLVVERLGVLLKGAPDLADIKEGAWRR